MKDEGKPQGKSVGNPEGGSPTDSSTHKGGKTLSSIWVTVLQYPAMIDEVEDGVFVVTFRDVPEALTQSSDEDLPIMAVDCLSEALSFYLEDGRCLPKPSSPIEEEYMIPYLVIEPFKEMLLKNKRLEKTMEKVYESMDEGWELKEGWDGKLPKGDTKYVDVDHILNQMDTLDINGLQEVLERASFLLQIKEDDSKH